MGFELKRRFSKRVYSQVASSSDRALLKIVGLQLNVKLALLPKDFRGISEYRF